MWILKEIKKDPQYGMGSDSKYKKENMTIAKLENVDLGFKISVHLYLPDNPTKCKNVIVSINGKERNSSYYRNIFVPYVADKNTLVISPRFKAKKLSRESSLKFGNMRKNNKVKSDYYDNLSSFEMIRDVFILIKDYLKIPASSFDIFGHSAGGQFCQRLLFFQDIPEIEKVFVANPGWFTFPDNSKDFPWGVKDRIENKALEHAFSKKLFLITGAKDINHTNLRKDPQTMKQGKNRHERALAFFTFSKNLSKDQKWKFNWKIVIDNDLEHSPKVSAKIASQIIFT